MPKFGMLEVVAALHEDWARESMEAKLVYSRRAEAHNQKVAKTARLPLLPKLKQDQSDDFLESCKAVTGIKRVFNIFKVTSEEQQTNQNQLPLKASSNNQHNNNNYRRNNKRVYKDHEAKVKIIHGGHENPTHP